MNERNERRLEEALEELDALQNTLSDLSRYADEEAESDPTLDNQDRAVAIEDLYEALYQAYSSASALIS